MSAVTAVPSWVTPATPAVSGLPAHPGAPRAASAASSRRSHLRAVPDLPAVADAPRAAVHITRRGRLLVTVGVLLLCLTAGVAGARAAMGAGSAPAYDTVVVQSGQTLTQVAQHAYPQLPVGNAIQRVQAANELNTLQVFAGERLQLPR